MWTTKDHGTPESACQALKETSSEPSILGPWPWQLFEQHKYTPDIELEIWTNSASSRDFTMIMLWFWMETKWTTQKVAGLFRVGHAILHPYNMIYNSKASYNTYV